MSSRARVWGGAPRWRRWMGALALGSMLLSLLTAQGSGHRRCDNPVCLVSTGEAADSDCCRCDGSPDRSSEQRGPGVRLPAGDAGGPGICGCEVATAADPGTTPSVRARTTSYGDVLALVPSPIVATAPTARCLAPDEAAVRFLWPRAALSFAGRAPPLS